MGRVLVINLDQVSLRLKSELVNQDIWGIYVELNYNGKACISPVVQGVVRKAPRGLFPKRQGNRWNVYLTGSMDGWFAVFDELVHGLMADVTLHARQGRSEKIYSASVKLNVSNVQSSSVMNASHAIVGMFCEGSVSLGLSLCLAQTIAGQPSSHSHFNSTHEIRDQDSNSEEEDFHISSSDSDEQNDLISNLKHQIMQHGSKNNWHKLLQGPLEEVKQISLSKKNVEEIFRNLGGTFTRKEFSSIFEHFAGKNSKTVDFEVLKKFLSGFEKESEALEDHSSSEDESNQGIFNTGDIVESRFHHSKTWASATIERIRKNHTAADVVYNDGSSQKSVPFSHLRKKTMKPSSGESEPEFNTVSEDSPDEFEEDFADAAIAALRAAIKMRKKKQETFDIFSFMEENADVPGRPAYISIEGFTHTMHLLGLRDEFISKLVKRFGDLSSVCCWKRLCRLLEKKNHVVADVNDILHRLRKSIQKNRRSNSMEAFELFDSDISMEVSHHDAIRACELLGCSLSVIEMNAVDVRLKSMGPNTRSGFINYGNLLRLVGDQYLGPDQLAVDFNGALKRMREQVSEQSIVRGECIDLIEPFEGLDRNGDGTVSFLQFAAGLSSIGLVVLAEDMQALVQRCRPRNDGFKGIMYRGPVNYRAFETLVNTDDILAQVLRPQLERCTSRGINPWGVFKGLDRYETREISKVDFRHVCLSAFGLRLKEHELLKLMKKFSTHKTHRVNYPAFLEFVSPEGTIGTIGDELSGLENKLRHQFQTVFSSDSLAEDILLSTPSKEISKEKLFKNLERLQIYLNQQEKTILSARFDPKQTGFIDRAAFVNFTGLSELQMDDLAQRVLQGLRKVTEEGVDYNIAFRVFDNGNSGCISRREFKLAIKDLGIKLNESELFSLMKRFSQFNNIDQIHYRSFLKFVVGRQQQAVRRMETTSVEESNRESRSRLKRGATAEHRLTVNGSGYDGLKTPSSLQDKLNDNVDIDDWLVHGASKKERKEYARLERSLDDYKHGVNQSHHGDKDPEELLYDHAAKTINRVVTHSTTNRKLVSRELQTSPRMILSTTSVGSYGVDESWEAQWTSETQLPRDTALMRSIIHDTFRPTKRPSKKKSHRKKHDVSSESSSSGSDALNPEWNDSSSSSGRENTKKTSRKTRSLESKSNKDHHRRSPERTSASPKRRNHNRSNNSTSSSDHRKTRHSRSRISSSSDSSISARPSRKSTTNKTRSSKKGVSSSSDSSRTQSRSRPNAKTRYAKTSSDSSSSDDLIARDIGAMRRSNAKK